MPVRLRCPNAYFGEALEGSTGAIRLRCYANRCKPSAAECEANGGPGYRFHIFNAADGSYRNEFERERRPDELKGLPGVREVKRDGLQG